MTVLLFREIDDLKKRLLALGAAVEQALDQALTALDERDADLAASVALSDREIDRMEVEIEEEGLKVLALHQPVAVDLRFIVAVIKMTNDLERIGDLATDLAERAGGLAWQPPLDPPKPLAKMRRSVNSMLGESLDALVNVDADLARRVCRSDDEVDELHRRLFTEVTAEMVEHPDRVERLVQYLSISRYLERVADHSTNIAEDVIYLAEGQIVRHEADRRQVESERSSEPPQPA